eukprot:1157775-Pelagomonas_calceolata.AAC.23
MSVITRAHRICSKASKLLDQMRKGKGYVAVPACKGSLAEKGACCHARSLTEPLFPASPRGSDSALVQLLSPSEAAQRIPYTLIILPVVPWLPALLSPELRQLSTQSSVVHVI